MNDLRKIWTYLLFLLPVAGYAQQSLSLKETVQTALSQSKSLKQDQTGVLIAESKRQTIKEARLPELSASGSLMYLPYAPNVDLKIQQAGGGQEGESQQQGFPVPKTVAFGGFNASLPIFTGFKLRNNLSLADKNLDLASLSAEARADQVAFLVTSLYLNLYKADEALKVLQKSIDRSAQKVKDYENFVTNGLMAENDLLKAKLQQASLEITREETRKSREMLEYRINVLLNRPPSSAVIPELNLLLPAAENPLIGINNRKDLALIRKKQEISGLATELVKSNFYPNLALTAGWINLHVPHTITVTNALNLGLGLKYNISSLYKNKSELKTAQLQALQTEQALSEAQDAAQTELTEARKDYELALKKQLLYEQTMQQAGENLRIVKNKNNNGLADTDQLLEAELQELQAAINLETGKADQQLAWFRLLSVSGTLLDYLQITN